MNVAIDNKSFVNFDLDVGADFLIDHVENFQATNWLGFCSIPAPIISMISIEQQFAEKVHVYTLPRTHINTRTKDLIDLILLSDSPNRPLESFLRSLQRVFKARNTHLLPDLLPEPPASWHKPFETIALKCGISPNLEEGFKKVSLFYQDLLRV